MEQARYDRCYSLCNVESLPARHHGCESNITGCVHLTRLQYLTVSSLAFMCYHIYIASMEKLQEEIKQKRPFSSLEEEAALNIARTAAVLEHKMIDLLRAHDITPTQYNVLRILRGAGKEGLCRNEVRDRMIAQVPDTTRLLDRMADMGLLVRIRQSADRRFVTTHITEKGLALLAQLDAPLAAANRRLFEHMTETELRFLIETLEKVREGRTNL